MNPITLQNGNVCGHNCQNIDTWIAKAFLTAFWLTERDKEWELCRNPGKCSSAQVTWLRAEERRGCRGVWVTLCCVYHSAGAPSMFPSNDHYWGFLWPGLSVSCWPLVYTGMYCLPIPHTHSSPGLPHHQTFTLTHCHPLLAMAKCGSPEIVETLSK